MKFSVTLTKEIYQKKAIEEALDAFSEYCHGNLKEEDSYFTLSLEDTTSQELDTETKDELLNYILEGCV